MEELVGQWWHRIVTRMADRSHADAAVQLADMDRQLGVIFRAMGGHPQWRLASASARQHGGPRGLMQRLAGSGQRAVMPVLDAETLALPPVLAVYKDQALNRALYIWLAGQGAMRLQLATMDAPTASSQGMTGNLLASQALLRGFPGWWPRYRQLVQAHLAQRPAPASLHGLQRRAEIDVQTALRHSMNDIWPHASADAGAGNPEQAAMPVPWWVVMEATAPLGARERNQEGRDGRPDAPAKTSDGTRRRARQTDDTSERHGLLMFFRTESLLSWAEFVKVNRQTDDDEMDDASQVANDMDTLSVAPGGQTLASRVRFDLDLPSAAADDLVIEQGVLLPEWDHRRACLLPDHCAVQLLDPKVSEPWCVPTALRVTASRMRRRLESARATPRWQGGYASGERLDVDAWVRWRAHGQDDGAEPRVFSRPQRQERSLATVLLADLSLSTDAWASQDARVIDVIRDALYVFGQAMDGLGDPFEMLGFSSVRRQNVRVHALKRFREPWGAKTRDRVGAIKPGYYTRMGAAIRYASQSLAARPERQKLLLLLTDGKPNDLDHYEGRFGLEDTRHAVQAARQMGLVPFCITIDEQAADYLPYLFGQQGYALVHKPQDLVSRLTQIVGQLSV